MKSKFSPEKSYPLKVFIPILLIWLVIIGMMVPLWSSHSITVILVTLLAAIAFYYMLIRQRMEFAILLENVKKSDDSFLGAFEGSSVGMAIISLDGRFKRVNNSLCEIVGYSESQLLTKTFQDITHPDDLVVNLDYMHKMLRGESSYYNLEKRYLRKNGGVVWVLVNASVVYGSENKPLYLVTQVQDISMRKTTEESLLKEHIYLEKEMQESTEELKRKIAELERFRKTTVDREFRIHDLIAELNKLKAQNINPKV